MARGDYRSTALGVIPWLEHHYAAEDSLDLWDPRPQRQGADLKITVIRLPRIANFTDVDPLLAEPSVSLEFLPPSSLGATRCRDPAGDENDDC